MSKPLQPWTSLQSRTRKGGCYHQQMQHFSCAYEEQGGVRDTEAGLDQRRLNSPFLWFIYRCLEKRYIGPWNSCCWWWLNRWKMVGQGTDSLHYSVIYLLTGCQDYASIPSLAALIFAHICRSLGGARIGAMLCHARLLSSGRHRGCEIMWFTTVRGCWNVIFRLILVQNNHRSRNSISCS